jgi:methionyl-tRNA synthetase
MPETILVAVAWPYGNSEIHVGNLVVRIYRPISTPVTSV